jgi:hypothetical protein
MIRSFSIALGFALQPKELKNHNLQMLFYKIENQMRRTLKQSR